VQRATIQTQHENWGDCVLFLELQTSNLLQVMSPKEPQCVSVSKSCYYCYMQFTFFLELDWIQVKQIGVLFLVLDSQ